MTTRRKTTHDRSRPEPEEETQPQPAPAPAPASAELAARVEALEAELEDSHNRHLRLAADFENYKKRARQEQLDTVQYATGTLIEKLLPVVDDFHRTLEHAPDGVDEPWLKGLQLTLQKLDEVLAEVGVQPIQAIGERFDPKVHEAVGAEESEDYPEDTVVAELRRGYRLHDRVLRPALVRVSRRPVAAS